MAPNVGFYFENQTSELFFGSWERDDISLSKIILAKLNVLLILTASPLHYSHRALGEAFYCFTIFYGIEANNVITATKT